MLGITIHDVSSIKITTAREQDLEYTETSFVKHFVICTKDGELNITLFADSEKALKIEKAKS